MDRFLAPHSPEALAHLYVTENGYSWDMDHASPPEQIIAHCASYKALDRYLSGRDLVILPRNRRELEGVLHRYCYDAIHNIIAKTRSSLLEGGYSRICYLAEASIHRMLDARDNTTVLLSLHRPVEANPHPHAPEPSKTPTIRI